MPNKTAPPNRIELEAAWGDLQSRMFQCFTQFFWILEIGPRLREAAPPARKLVANAVVESTLLAVRDLDDFFAKDRERDGDIRAIHFGYHSPGSFLTKDERDGINQKLVHLTYRAIREGLKVPGGPNPRQWNAADLIERAMSCAIPFLEFLERSFFAGNAATSDDIRAARQKLTEYLHVLQTMAELEKAAFKADEE